MRLPEATEIVADLAAQQWGLLTAAQAREAGVVAVELSRLVDRGVLWRVRHGVYASASTPATAVLEVRAQWLALEPRTLAAERGAAQDRGPVVSHETAAWLHGIGDLHSEAITFTTSSRRQTRQPEVRLLIGALSPEEISVIEGLPVTSVGRTVFDLARAGHEPSHLTDLLGDALSTGVVTRDELAEALAPVAERFGAVRNTAIAMGARLEELYPSQRPDAGADLVSRLVQQALEPVQRQLRDLFAEALPTPHLPGAITQVQLPAAFDAVAPDTMLSPGLRAKLEDETNSAARAIRDALPASGAEGVDKQLKTRRTTRATGGREDAAGGHNHQDDDA